MILNNKADVQDKQRREAYRMVQRDHSVLQGRLIIVGVLLCIGVIYFGALFWWVT